MTPRAASTLRTSRPNPGLLPGVSAALLALLGATTALADGPADNLPDKVRPVPPPGIAVPEGVRGDLQQGVDQLRRQVQQVRIQLATKPDLLRRLPDAEIFLKSVDWAIRYNEFFKTNEFDAARVQLREAGARLEALATGSTPWTSQRGPVVAGYVSRIDQSIQPYGVVVPDTYQPGSGRKHRLDFWFHGRGEVLSELAFLNDRMKSRGEFAPADTFVLHLYGRYCNGDRFAGETDFWEAFDDIKRRYPIDEDRLVVRGFSLGGAACWHMATHHASRWAAAAPGAGFSETAEFLRVFQRETLQPPVWERTLWRLYDSTEHALNVSMVPLVAYSGEDDSQIQAARAMERALRAENLEMTHIIAPKTGHRYEPAAKAEINRRIDAIAARGRDPLPRQVRFVTHSLRYNEMAWVRVDRLARHWEHSRVEATLSPGDNTIAVTTANVTALTLDIPSGLSPFEPRREIKVTLDGVVLNASRPGSDRSWRASFHREGGTWRTGGAVASGLRKQHGLQGPIDDAFMDSFVMVAPELHPDSAAGKWVDAEMRRAVEQWRRQFRGDAIVKTPQEVTEADIAASNLVIWGDPASNSLLARIADRLPIQWKDGQLVAGSRRYSAADHMPILIHPNPLNPRRYVVVNSGFTYREYDYLNNARQTPKLPDWAIVDLSQPPNARTPGRIADADFFGEQWEIQ